jgi:hypothetical protein
VSSLPFSFSVQLVKRKNTLLVTFQALEFYNFEVSFRSCSINGESMEQGPMFLIRYAHHSAVGVLAPFASVQAAAYIVGGEALVWRPVGQRVPATEMLGDLFYPLLRDAGIVLSNRFLGYHLIRTIYCLRSRGSSGSIVSDYGLDDRAIGVRSPAEAEDFSSSLCVQTGSGVHPASCTMGTGGPFPGDKERPGRDADHSPPSSADVESLCLFPPQAPSWRVMGQL